MDVREKRNGKKKRDDAINIEKAYRRLDKMVSCRFRYCQPSKNTCSFSLRLFSLQLWVNYRNLLSNFNAKHCARG